MEFHVARVSVAGGCNVQMWVAASGATNDLFFTTIQPILDSYRPPGVTALAFKKVSLGTIPPKVQYSLSEERVARCWWTDSTVW